MDARSIATQVLISDPVPRDLRNRIRFRMQRTDSMLTSGFPLPVSSYDLDDEQGVISQVADAIAIATVGASSRNDYARIVIAV
jgi:hypothetical protein